MERITRHDLLKLKKELESLECQARELAYTDYPDEIAINWTQKRLAEIKNILNHEEKKARFTELGLTLLQ